MVNPFGSERDAYRFVLITLAAFAAIAVGDALGGVAVGVAVWGAVSFAAVSFYILTARAARPVVVVPHVGDPDEKRIVVLAREPLSATAVGRIRREAAGFHARIAVVCPADVGSLHHWTSDVDRERTRAAATLAACLDELHRAGLPAEGVVGDEDPLRALEDAVRAFGADELIVAGDERVARRTRARFAVPLVAA